MSVSRVCAGEKQDDDNIKQVHMDAFLASAQRAPSTDSRPFLYDLWHVRQQPVRLKTGASWQELGLHRGTRVTQCRSPVRFHSPRNPADRPRADEPAAVLIYAKFSYCMLIAPLRNDPLCVLQQPMHS